MKVIIQLGKNGDIAMVARHILRKYNDVSDMVWVVAPPYAPILKELFPQFNLWILSINPNTPLEAAKLAALRYPEAEIIIPQQNGADDALLKTLDYANYQQYQFANS
jgi:hypothetical protein